MAVPIAGIVGGTTSMPPRNSDDPLAGLGSLFSLSVRMSVAVDQYCGSGVFEKVDSVLGTLFTTVQKAQLESCIMHQSQNSFS